MAPGISSYQDYLGKIEEVCARRQFYLARIGIANQQREYPLLKVSIGRPEPRPGAVCFAAGIHGDEPAGPLGVLRFLQGYDPGSHPCVDIVILPAVNPWGFDHRKRTTAQRRDINRHFNDKIMEHENKLVVNALRRYRFGFFSSLHEDNDERGYYLYNYERKEEPIYRELIQAVKRVVPINPKSEIEGDPARDGMITNPRHRREASSLERWMQKQGVPFVMCSETPGKAALEKRVQATARIMERIVAFCERRERKGASSIA